ncbi:helix-turn-helix domain-containing protein [Lutibacter citreus]|uniref:helix-turn-helix domain-containing protein n=1 Tax=Lutibacter citreus TaxID=2138210 RepID=UPI000DBE10C1|nr:helix-turn-helix domain-containing protein [Lutibacter citreus]
MNKLNKQKIAYNLDKICKSDQFINSGRNIRLLNFLVEKALDDSFVKEQVIGFELFEKDYNPDERNSKVRVYMYKLRQKLEEYYKNDGKFDELKFEIKKGQYNLNFVEEQISTKTKLSWWKIATPIVIALIIAAIYLNPFEEKDNIWTSFFNSSNETICFISDQFIVSKKEGDNILFTYILNVDDKSELNEYQNQVKDTSYNPATFSYITKMAPVAIHSLTKLFLKNDTDFSVELESDFKYDDLKKKNLIFIGQYNCLHQSKNLFLDNSKVFKTNKGSFQYYTKNDTINYFNKVLTDKALEYAMVSYRKMDNGNNVLFFSSNHDIGVIATVRNFTNEVWLKKFNHEFVKNGESFNALFEVTGYKRTELESKLIQIEVLE